MAKWNTPNAIQTIMSTELNSLANNANAIAGSAINNETGLGLFADFLLTCTFAVSPTAETFLNLYLLPSLDGTNYPDGSNTITPNSNCLIGALPVRAVNTVQRINLPKVALPPFHFLILVRNEATGAALSATGNTLVARTYFYN
jgi:hypothetical protein